LTEAKRIIEEKYGIVRSTRALTRLCHDGYGQRRNPKVAASEWLMTEEDIEAAVEYFRTYRRKGGGDEPTD